MWDSRNGGKASREKQEEFYKREKRKQAGIAFPSAGKQEHLLIIRFDTLHTPIEEKNRKAIRAGLQRLCDFFERIDNGKFKMYHLFEDGDLKSVPLSDFNFSVTLGFGKGFFEKLGITLKNVPKKLKRIPSYSELGDQGPYTLFQTDFIIQLGSTKEDVNRYIFQNVTSTEQEEKGPNDVYNGYHGKSEVTEIRGEQTDIYSIIADWAKITDIHEGFQRIDGRNLMGFNDGISNPSRLSNDVVWTSKEEEDQKFNDGSYMVFLKIEHDLEKWRKMSVEHQEEWIGRRKETGLLLGTMSREQDQKLASDLKSDDPVIRQHAFKVWKRFYDEQKDPEKKFFDINQTQFKSIQAECPVWSHIRKSNPRQADGAARSLIFRRGYLFANGGLGGKFDSGLLFICFQKDIEKGFEYIMKNFLHNKNFPVPDFRRFNSEELIRRQKHGRFTELEIKKGMSKIKFTHDPDAQNTGEEGLSGPSELGVYSRGQFSVTRTLGGGYYFIPPIPHKKISEISEQFFD